MLLYIFAGGERLGINGDPGGFKKRPAATTLVEKREKQCEGGKKMTQMVYLGRLKKRESTKDDLTNVIGVSVDHVGEVLGPLSREVTDSSGYRLDFVGVIDVEMSVDSEIGRNGHVRVFINSRLS
jgi:hypothetical protein